MKERHNRILLVDDEPQIRVMLRDILEQQGYVVATAKDCAQAMEEYRQFLPDAVLLDVMLPDGDGFTLCEQIRCSSDLPVLFLSARDEDEARLKGLGLGADDYITKPFLPKELLLRLAAVMRRGYREEQKQELCLGNRVIDWGAGTVSWEGNTVQLTAKEYTLLRKLWENRGNIVTVDALCSSLWDGVLIGYENTLMVHIRRLREKIEEDPSHPKWLLTVRGLGYRLAKEKAGIE